MPVFPSLYRAKAVAVRSGAVEAYVPQVFGDAAITVTDGSLPGAPGMGWVFFQAGNPEFPVWFPTTLAEGAGAAAPAVDEVWVGPEPPADPAIEIWYDTDELA